MVEGSFESIIFHLNFAKIDCEVQNVRVSKNLGKGSFGSKEKWSKNVEMVLFMPLVETNGAK